ncbi:YcfL family protein [Siccibacter turicensis]|uniref:YcfL family protein n=1 Tax=Siccibacter turicensis TaxID=357233 RepID=UPI0004A2C1E0|nr:YcfL family protein [Siccibacter turicensis]
MTGGRIVPLLLAFALVGCGSSPQIPVNDDQTLVMESSVLAAGITAQKPEYSIENITPSASSTLYNERDKPVTVNYRFYWYDAKGLEMHPLEAPRSVTVPAHSSVAIFASSHYLGARKVRLYLYL